MCKRLEEWRIYIVNDFNTGGFKIRMLARSHMMNAVLILLLHTYWLFGLPKNWDPSLKGQGPYDGRHFRIFCFMIYNVSLFINCGHFFNGLLLYNCVDQGIKDKKATLETSKFWILFSSIFIVINFLKFIILFVHLHYTLEFSLIMTVPEVVLHCLGICVIIYFRSEVRQMAIMDELGTYSIGKNGKIIFD